LFGKNKGKQVVFAHQSGVRGVFSRLFALMMQKHNSNTKQALFMRELCLY